MGKKKDMNKINKRHRVLKVILIILIILLMLSVGCLGAFYYLFGNLNTVDFTSDNTELGISDETTTSAGGITNIALFGVDTRDTSEDSGLSDAIIILTVDQDNNIIKMTSILRDSKVPIDGYGENKINAAYSYGGPTLAIKTLNENFDLDIKEYVTVNFSQLADIVNAVGGVTLTLTEEEVEAANGLLSQYFPDATKIAASGEVTLTGEQAVSYSRIRKIDSDNERASRQQKVLSAVFAQIKTMSKSDYPSFIRQFLGTAETSLSYSEILALSPIVLTNFTIEQYTIPDANYETDLWGGIDTDGVWYWIYDLDEAADRIHTIIDGEDETTTDTETEESTNDTEGSTSDSVESTNGAE